MFRFLDRTLPSSAYVNPAFLLARFVRAHNRLPRDPARFDATFNDLIFHRLVRADWSKLERFCIDKEYVKTFVRCIYPEVKTARTVEIIRPTGSAGSDHLESSLASRRGDPVVAKPTQGSGSILFLGKKPSRKEVRQFCARATQSYYRVSRESQYRDLERKIMLEEDLSVRGSPPVDFKFFCACGEVLFCQVDLDRFSRHRRALVTTRFESIPVRYMYDLPTEPVVKPANFDEMVAAAQKLSAFFPFVRVDLYSARGAVFLGELTFAPEAGSGPLSNEEFGAGVMARVRKANRADRASLHAGASPASVCFAKVLSHEH
jgi:hypothetical protein